MKEKNISLEKISIYRVSKWISIAIIFIFLVLLGTSYIYVYINESADVELSYYNKYQRFDTKLSDNISVKSSSGSLSPIISLTKPNKNMAKRGDDITLLVKFQGNIASCDLGPGAIVLNKFVGTIILNQIDDTTVRITVKNIDTQDFSVPKSIEITGGAAISTNGEMSNKVKSDEFNIQRAGLMKFLYFIEKQSGSMWAILVALLPFILYRKKRENS